jgi:hypothetical protein
MMTDVETQLKREGALVSANTASFIPANRNNLRQALKLARGKKGSSIQLLRSDEAILWAQRSRQGWHVYLGRGLRGAQDAKRFPFIASTNGGPTSVNAHGLRGLFAWRFPIVDDATLEKAVHAFAARSEHSSGVNWARLEA